MRLYGAVYVTIGKNGPRYHSFARGRLWPMRREVAEASFAAGATVYRKNAGECIWQVDPIKIEEGAGQC